MYNSAQQRGYRDAEYNEAKRHDLLKKSSRTAIRRNKMSAPCVWLMENDKLHGEIMDYGCGKGDDVEQLNINDFDAVGYDPNHQTNATPMKDKYDTVLCNYVLNVVQPEYEQGVINMVRSLLKPGGTAFITVRRDIKKEGFTSINTYQRNVVLDLPIVKEIKTGYCIYKLERNDEDINIKL